MANRRNNINPFRSYKTQADVFTLPSNYNFKDPGVSKQKGERSGNNKAVISKYFLLKAI